MEQKTVIHTSTTDCQNTTEFPIWQENGGNLFIWPIQKDLPGILRVCLKLRSKKVVLEARLRQELWLIDCSWSKRLAFIRRQQIVRTLQNFQSGMKMKEANLFDRFRKICLEFCVFIWNFGPKKLSLKPDFVRNFDWLIDLAYNWIFNFFATRKEFFFRIFQPIRTTLIALCQNKRTACSETAFSIELLKQKWS